jgi:glycine/D-amino acid oxidase-like deaminating enzyme
MIAAYDVVVVGGGVFGVSAALELRGRGHKVALLDQGQLPHPLAASTDISKVVRMEYGRDEEYMAMVERAREGWIEWNELFGETLYHETGVAMFTTEPMAPGGFEYESYERLLRRGHSPERLDAAEIVWRFPAWSTGRYVDGFFHAKGGYAESGRVVAALVEKARALGVSVFEGQTVRHFVERGDRVEGVETQEGMRFQAGMTVVAAGTWTHWLLPELRPMMRTVGQPVFHLKPNKPAIFRPPEFVVFTADVARTGWYGFPQQPGEGVVKIANHGAGQRLHPDEDERVVGEIDEEKLRSFLAETFPSLVGAPVTYTRRCLYSDTLDEHLWIDRHPVRRGLVVAAGGSGHGFKFAPILGELIADAVEGKPNEFGHKFRWRALSPETAGQEAARHHG